MTWQKEITLPPLGRGFHLITHLIEKELNSLPANGLLHIFVQHTSAGITINENADITVRQDFETVFNLLVKENENYYKHTLEGSDDMPAHIKTALVGNSVSIPITNHQMNLGIWQGIYFCEFRNAPQRRKIVLTLIS
jgi:secondary thiamine-phosphate synthase enzyme